MSKSKRDKQNSNYIYFTRRNTKTKIKGGKWSIKYKKSINCNHPKGFSQRQHCKYGRTYKKEKYKPI